MSANIQRNNDVKHKCIKLRWNNTLYPSLNAFNGKPDPYRNKGVLQHYHYRFDTNLGTFVVAIIRTS